MARRIGYDDGFFDLSYEGKSLLEEEKTLQGCNVQNGGTIEIDTWFGVAKQAMYLRKPAGRNNINVSLTVSCVPPFTVRNAHLPMQSSREHSYTWDIAVGSIKSDGDNHNIRTRPFRYSYRYLSWTGETSEDPNRLPHVQPRARDNIFNPSAPSLTLANACVLRVGEFIPFLEHTLARLHLTPQMRSDFLLRTSPQLLRIIEFWPCIAFRFVNQDAFSQASRIEVSLADEGRQHLIPAVVSRIFLLFGGVDRSMWKRTALTLEEAEGIDWAARIGLDVQKMLDDTRFRVIEVGSMEVPLFKER